MQHIQKVRYSTLFFMINYTSPVSLPKFNSFTYRRTYVMIRKFRYVRLNGVALGLFIILHGKSKILVFRVLRINYFCNTPMCNLCSSSTLSALEEGKFVLFSEYNLLPIYFQTRWVLIEGLWWQLRLGWDSWSSQSNPHSSRVRTCVRCACKRPRTQEVRDVLRL